MLRPRRTTIIYDPSHGNVTRMELSYKNETSISQDVTFANRFLTFPSFNPDSWDNSNTDKMPLKKVIKRGAAPWRRGGEAVTFHFSCSISKAAPLKTPRVIFPPQPICEQEPGNGVQAVTAAG